MEESKEQIFEGKEPSIKREEASPQMEESKEQKFESAASTINKEEFIENDHDRYMHKHIFVVGALGADKSTTMSVLFNPTDAATE